MFRFTFPKKQTPEAKLTFVLLPNGQVKCDVTMPEDGRNDSLYYFGRLMHLATTNQLRPMIQGAVVRAADRQGLQQQGLEVLGVFDQYEDAPEPEPEQYEQDGLVVCPSEVFDRQGA